MNNVADFMRDLYRERASKLHYSVAKRFVTNIKMIYTLKCSKFEVQCNLIRFFFAWNFHMISIRLLNIPGRLIIHRKWNSLWVWRLTSFITNDTEMREGEKFNKMKKNAIKVKCDLCTFQLRTSTSFFANCLLLFFSS